MRSFGVDGPYPTSADRTDRHRFIRKTYMCSICLPQSGQALRLTYARHISRCILRKLASKSLHSRCQSARRQLFAKRRNWSRRSQRPNAGIQQLLLEWWSQTGSNRRPEACKATALPTELWPRLTHFTRSRINDPSLNLVGLGRLELPTSRLSSARSNQLSYKPGTQRTSPGTKTHSHSVATSRERET